MSQILPYLEMTVRFRREHMQPAPEGFEYICFEEYVLRNGHVQESKEPLTRDEELVVEAAINRAGARGHNVMEMRQCFSNAQLLVICDVSDELVYNEGYAVGRSICVHHGWVTINGKVVDTTWQVEKPASRSFLPRHPVGELPAGYEYFGFPVENEDYIEHRIEHRELVGSLLDDWHGNYPLLRGYDPNDDESVCEFYDEIEEAS